MHEQYMLLFISVEKKWTKKEKTQNVKTHKHKRESKPHLKDFLFLFLNTVYFAKN